MLLLGLLGIGVYWGRWRATVERVVVSPRALEIVTSSGGVTRLPWPEIGWVESRLVSSARGERVGQILIRRRDGSAVELPADLPDLDRLMRLIHSPPRPTAPADRAAPGDAAG